jgi:mRNA-degrading endonuclease toxin of MazEF toxin-antitoxin module
LILKVYNKRNIVILPITTKIKNDRFHFKMKTKNKVMYVKLTQVKTIDTKRFLRKIDIVPNDIFLEVIKLWKNSI